MNPPYERGILSHWMGRFFRHGNGIALVNARTETSWFVRWVWPKASAVFFPAGRVRFCRPDGRTGNVAGSPSVFVAMGDEAADRLSRLKLRGQFIRGPFRNPRVPVPLPAQLLTAVRLESLVTRGLPLAAEPLEDVSNEVGLVSASLETTVG